MKNKKIFLAGTVIQRAEKKTFPFIFGLVCVLINNCFIKFYFVQDIIQIFEEKVW